MTLGQFLQNELDGNLEKLGNRVTDSGVTFFERLGERLKWQKTTWLRRHENKRDISQDRVIPPRPSIRD